MVFIFLFVPYKWSVCGVCVVLVSKYSWVLNGDFMKI